MSKPILVLGATGNVGAPLVQALAARGVRARAATRDPARYRGPGEPVAFDFARHETWAPALEGVERLFLLVLPGDADAARYGVPLIDAAEAAGVRRVVVLSAMGVEHAPPEVALRAVELAAQRSGLEWTLLRPNWFMQNFSAGFLAAPIRHDGVVPVPAGDAKVSFVDTRDIAAVAARALLDDDLVGAELALTGPEALDHAEVAATLTEVAGRPIRYVPLTAEAFADGMRGAGLPESVVGQFGMLFASLRAGNAAPTTGDVARVLGRPPTGLASFARELAASWRG